MTPSLLLRKRGPGPEAPRLPTSDHRPEPFVALPEHREVQSEGGPPPTSRLSPAPGFALVATLLMITVITGAAVAFFQSTRIERFVSRNYADLARAQLAAESGHALAASLLRAATANDHFIVVLNPTNRQLFLGNGSNQTALSTFAYLPLFSHATNPTSYTTNSSDLVTASNQPAMSVDGGVTFTNTLPGGLTVTSPAVSWINLTNADGRTNARFAFWVEDLSGRLDLSVAGSTGTNTARPTGTNPAELALWSLFNPTAIRDTNNAVVISLTNLRAALLTTATARLVSASVNTNLLPHLASGLVHAQEVEVIPYGFGYADAGKAKFNINNFIAGQDVSAIATIISNNLPNFGSERMGGFPPEEDYILTIAASAIDYADNDSTPTVGSGYRGVDSTPFTTILYNQYDWHKKDSANISLRLATYIQLWNISDKTISGNFTLVQTNQDTITELGWSPGITSESTDITNLRPNQVLVLKFLTDTNIDTGAFEISGNELNIAGNKNYSFSTQWNGKVCDQTRSPGERVAKILELQPSSKGPDWSGFMPGLRYQPYKENLADQQCGDPRSTYYLAGTLEANDFDLRSAWGGMAVMRPAGNRYQTRPWFWSDAVTNDAVSAPGATSASSLDTKITSLDQLTNGSASGSTNTAPQKINNSGSYQRITELGNLYDPGQWNYTGYPSNDIPANASADSKYGGGMSLRIGKAEHPKFTSDGTRASQLLDLFAAGPAGAGGSVTNSIAGRINLNTATTNTLRALAAGVVHTNDPVLVSLVGNGTNFVVPPAGVAAFVSGVTNFRSQRPFFAVSQLNDITNSTGTYPTNAVFGNRTFGTGVQWVTQWQHAAAEEWFSKIYSLATVRSRNFLVHVIGQAMTTNTTMAARPLATARRMYQIHAQPVPDSTTGLTTNVNVQMVRSWAF